MRVDHGFQGRDPGPVLARPGAHHAVVDEDHADLLGEVGALFQFGNGFRDIHDDRVLLVG